MVTGLLNLETGLLNLVFFQRTKTVIEESDDDDSFKPSGTENESESESAGSSAFEEESSGESI